MQRRPVLQQCMEGRRLRPGVTPRPLWSSSEKMPSHLFQQSGIKTATQNGQASRSMLHFPPAATSQLRGLPPPIWTSAGSPCSRALQTSVEVPWPQLSIFPTSNTAPFLAGALPDYGRTCDRDHRDWRRDSRRDPLNLLAQRIYGERQSSELLKVPATGTENHAKIGVRPACLAVMRRDYRCCDVREISVPPTCTRSDCMAVHIC